MYANMLAAGRPSQGWVDTIGTSLFPYRCPIKAAIKALILQEKSTIQRGCIIYHRLFATVGLRFVIR